MKRHICFASIPLLLMLVISCSRNSASFQVLLARIEQRPDMVTNALVETAIKKAFTSSDKLALLQLSSLLSDEGILDTAASCKIARAFLQQYQTDEVMYCSLSILIDAGYVNEALSQLSLKYFETFPELFAELAERNAFAIIKNKWLSASQFEYLAEKFSCPKFYMYACILSLIEEKFCEAQMQCKKALQAGYEVPVALLWYVHAYDEILARGVNSGVEQDIDFLLDAAFIEGNIEIMEKAAQVIKNSNNKKYVLTVAYCYVKEYLYANNQKKILKQAWTNDDHHDEQLYELVENMLKMDALKYDDYHICASYMSFLFYAEKYEALHNYVAAMPKTEKFENLHLFTAIVFDSGPKAVAEAIIASSKYPNNYEIQRTALLILAKNGQWQDFEHLFKATADHNIDVRSNFLKFVYAILELPNLEKHSDFSFERSSDFYYDLNKGKVLELAGRENDAMRLYEMLLASASAASEKICVIKCLVMLSKKMGDETNFARYVLFLQELEEDSVLAISELAKNRTF